jgi:hypothetical protein
MAPEDNGNRSARINAETTAALPDDDLGELHEPTSPSAEEAVASTRVVYEPGPMCWGGVS